MKEQTNCGVCFGGLLLCLVSFGFVCLRFLGCCWGGVFRSVWFFSQGDGVWRFFFTFSQTFFPLKVRRAGCGGGLYVSAEICFMSWCFTLKLHGLCVLELMPLICMC